MFNWFKRKTETQQLAAYIPPPQQQLPYDPYMQSDIVAQALQNMGLQAIPGLQQQNGYLNLYGYASPSGAFGGVIGLQAIPGIPGYPPHQVIANGWVVCGPTTGSGSGGTATITVIEETKQLEAPEPEDDDPIFAL